MTQFMWNPARRLPDGRMAFLTVCLVFFGTVTSEMRGADIVIPAREHSARSENVVPVEASYSGLVVCHGHGGMQQWEAHVTEAGTYYVHVYYEAAQSRPVTLTINEKRQDGNFLTRVTGGWTGEHLAWETLGPFDLKQGKNVLRINAAGYMPHLAGLVIANSAKQWDREAFNELFPSIGKRIQDMQRVMAPTRVKLRDMLGTDEIVFDWKRSNDEGYRIYEVGVDGTGLRQILAAPDNEVQLVATYRLDYHNGTDDMHPCYLPDGGIAFVSTRCQTSTLCHGGDAFTTTVLYRMDADGGNLRQLSFGALSEFTPTVLPDGRIMYARWEYVDKGAVAAKCIWAMNPDGSASVEIYGNDIDFPTTMIQARPIPGAPKQYVLLGCPHYPQNALGRRTRSDRPADEVLLGLVREPDCRAARRPPGPSRPGLGSHDRRESPQDRKRPLPTRPESRLA
jgi:hypothetical protein